jgi:hypothetical protein
MTNLKKIFPAFFMAVSGFLTVMAQDNHFRPAYSTIINSSKREYMCRPPANPSQQTITGYWDIQSSDVEKLDSNFKKILKLKSQELSVNNLEAFAYQYSGFIINGKKYIYINAFYNSPKSNPEFRRSNWKNEPVIVRDGGPNYWQAIFDMDNLDFIQIRFNGSV